jgi:hypothetical protein
MIQLVRFFVPSVGSYDLFTGELNIGHHNLTTAAGRSGECRHISNWTCPHNHGDVARIRDTRLHTNPIANAQMFYLASHFDHRAGSFVRLTHWPLGLPSPFH